MLSQEEKIFINSIKNKIEKYKIEVSLEEAIGNMSGDLRITKYNDKKTEIVDVEIEKFLIRKSCNYFIRKYALISLPPLGIVPFDMYYIQEKTVEDFQKYKNNISLKTRQVGMSTVTASFALWKMLDDTKLEVIDIISATEAKAKDFKKKIYPTLENLPLFLLPKIKDRASGEYRYLNSLNELKVNNTTQLELPNGSIFKCETASESAGRSDALSLLILDEAAHFKTGDLIEEIWKSAAPTLLKTNGNVIVISTPRGIINSGKWYYQKWMEAKNGGSFHPILIDWWEIPDDAKGNKVWLDELVKRDYYNNPSVREEGAERARYEEEHIEENKWLKGSRDDLGVVGFRQEVLHDFIITGEGVFSPEKLEKIKSRTKNPIYKDRLNDEAIRGFWIWELPKKDRKYVMAVDSSRGSGRDASSIQIIDPISYNQVAEFRGLISTKRLGVITRKIAKFYNNAYLIIECNNLGEATFNEVYYNDNEPYENIYKKSTTRQGNTITIGWDTTPALRILMTEEFINFLSNDKLFDILKINSIRLHEELTTWVFNGSKPEHSQGFHDDLIIAYCMALYNRSRYLNKDSFIIGSNDQIDYSIITDEDIQSMKEGRKNDEEDIEELEEKRKLDKMVNRYNIDYYDYSWLLGSNPQRKDKYKELKNMFFFEASKLTIDIEKNNSNKLSSKSNKSLKDKVFSDQKINKIMDELDNDKDNEKLIKYSEQLSKKTKRQINVSKNISNRKFKNPMGMVRNRMLKILNRGL